jgi:hypothetical protein
VGARTLASKQADNGDNNNNNSGNDSNGNGNDKKGGRSSIKVLKSETIGRQR